MDWFRRPPPPPGLQETKIQEIADVSLPPPPFTVTCLLWAFEWFPALAGRRDQFGCLFAFCVFFSQTCIHIIFKLGVRFVHLAR